MKKIIIYGIVFLAGFASFFLISQITEMMAVSKQKLIVDDSLIEENLFKDKIKKQESVSTIFIANIFGETQFVFYDDKNQIIGFKFYKDSYQGYAKLKKADDKIIGFDVYNIYDIDLFRNFRPSSVIRFYCDNNIIFVYDSFQRKLFKFENNDLRTLNVKGVKYQKIFPGSKEFSFLYNILKDCVKSALQFGS